MLFFEDTVQRSKFVDQLQSDLKEMTLCLTIKQMSEKELLKEAVTKEQRAQIVETFFRHAFAKVNTGDTSVVLSVHIQCSSKVV